MENFLTKEAVALGVTSCTISTQYSFYYQYIQGIN